MARKRTSAAWSNRRRAGRITVRRRIGSRGLGHDIVVLFWRFFLLLAFVFPVCPFLLFFACPLGQFLNGPRRWSGPISAEVSCSLEFLPMRRDNGSKKSIDVLISIVASSLMSQWTVKNVLFHFDLNGRKPKQNKANRAQQQSSGHERHGKTWQFFSACQEQRSNL